MEQFARGVDAMHAAYRDVDGAAPPFLHLNLYDRQRSPRHLLTIAFSQNKPHSGRSVRRCSVCRRRGRVSSSSHDKKQLRGIQSCSVRRGVLVW